MLSEIIEKFARLFSELGILSRTRMHEKRFLRVSVQTNGGIQTFGWRQVGRVGRPRIENIEKFKVQEIDNERFFIHSGMLLSDFRVLMTSLGRFLSSLLCEIELRL